uniref:Integrin alpha-2 domain-containing protein n=1 Tax=Timema douglasi TaxID=61478 RepID=A0A7R8V9C2_TIMDO|nr:unnamed protein product [Timema douglasi]
MTRRGVCDEETRHVTFFSLTWNVSYKTSRHFIRRYASSTRLTIPSLDSTRPLPSLLLTASELLLQVTELELPTLQAALRNPMPASSGANKEILKKHFFFFLSQQLKGWFDVISIHLELVSVACTIWLVVGAPRANSTLQNHLSIFQPGVTYQCDLSQDNKCSQIVLDPTGNGKKLAANGFSYKHKKDNAWIGGAIDVVEGRENSPLVVCGPRWKNNINIDYYLMNGICYWSSPNSISRPDRKAEEWLPLLGSNKQGYTIKPKHPDENSTEVFYYAYGEAGISVHLVKDESGFNQPYAPNPYYTPKLTSVGYFGYSLGSGQFFQNASQTLYVSGAPRAANYKGKPSCLIRWGIFEENWASPTYDVSVFIFDFPWNNDMPLKILLELEGYQMGEYFGATLCVVDLNNDGLDDLVVGAPLHSLGIHNSGLPTGDEGRVYVYINQEEGRMTEVAGEIMGSSVHGARFGSSIANIGDINLDGYADVAVGAYDSGHAVVLKSRPVVSLHAEITADVRKISFNASNFRVAVCISFFGKFARVIGADLTMKVDPTYGRAQFYFDPDYSTNIYTYYVTLELGLPVCRNFTVKIREGLQDFSKPIAVSLEYKLQDNLPIPVRRRRATEEFCKTCPILDPDMPSTVVLRVPYATGCGEEDTCRTDLKLTAELLNIKLPYIIGTLETVSLHITVISLLEPAFLSRVIVEIPKETALVRMPPTCQQVSTTNTIKYLHLECDTGNPLISDEKRVLELELDMKGVPANTKELTFNVTAISVGDEQNNADNNVLIHVPLHTISDVRIVGKSSQDQLLYSKQNESKIEDLIVIHSYEVRNYGPSPVDAVQMEFQVPITLKAGGKTINFLKLYQPEVYLDNQPFNCKASKFPFYTDNISEGSGVSLDEPQSGALPDGSHRRRRSVNNQDGELSSLETLPINRTLFVNCSQPDTLCMTVTCARVGPLLSSYTKAMVHLRMRANLRLLDPIMDKKDVVLVSTNGVAIYQYLNNSLRPLSDNFNKTSVSTMFLGKIPAENIATWIIILAIIGGILIFMLLVLGLIKIEDEFQNDDEEL